MFLTPMFSNINGDKVIIRDHVSGHKYGNKALGLNKGDQTAHFNVVDANGKTFKGSQDHYNFNANSKKDYLDVYGTKK